MPTINVTTDTTLSGLTYAAGDLINVYNNAKLTINASTTAKKTDTIQVANAQGEIRIENASTTTPIVVEMNAISSDINFTGNGILRTRGRWISIATGTGAAGQTINFNSAVGGVPIDIPCAVLVEKARLGDNTTRFDLTARPDDAMGSKIWRITWDGVGTNPGFTDDNLANMDQIVLAGFTNAANNDIFPVEDYSITQNWIEFRQRHYSTCVAEADKTSITLKTAAYWLNIGDSVTDTAGSLAMSLFGGTWELGRFFSYVRSTKVATFGNGTNGHAIPSGSKVYFPNIHLTGAYTNVYANKCRLNGNPAGLVDFDTMSLSPSFMSSNMQSSRWTRIVNLIMSGGGNNALAVNTNGNADIQSVAAGLDQQSANASNVSPFFISGCTGAVKNFRNTTSIHTDIAAGVTAAAIQNLNGAFIFNTARYAARTLGAGGSIRFNLIVNSVMRNVLAVGQSLFPVNMTNCYLYNTRHSDQMSAANSTTNAQSAISTNFISDFVFHKVRGIGAAPRNYIAVVESSSKNVVVHDVIYDGASNLLGLGVCQGKRMTFANFVVDNINGANILITAPIAEGGRYADIRTNNTKDLLFSSGMDVDGIVQVIPSSSSGGTVDVPTFFLLWDTSAKTDGRIMVGLFTPEITREYFELVSGAEAEVYHDNIGGLFLTANGNQIIQTAPVLIRGVNSFKNAAPTIGGTATGTLTFEYAISADKVTWGNWKSLTGANLSGETLPSYLDGFYLRVRITASGADATRKVTSIMLTANTESTYTPIIDTRNFDLVGCDVGATMGTFTTGGTLVGTAVADANGRARLAIPCLFDNVPVSYNYKLRKAGYRELTGSLAMNFLDVEVPASQALDRVVAAPVGIVSVSGAASSITATSDTDVLSVYDTAQAWAAQAANLGYAVPITKTTDTIYTLAPGWSLIAQGALTLTGYTLVGTLDITAGLMIGGAIDGTVRVATGTTCGGGTAISGKIVFTAAGIYDLCGATISGTITLENTSGGAVTIKLPPDAAFTNNGPNITVDNTVVTTLTITGFEPGSDIVIYDNAVPSTGDGSNVLATGDAVSGSFIYDYTGVPEIRIGVFKSGFVPQVSTVINLTTTNSSYTIQQRADRNYA